MGVRRNLRLLAGFTLQTQHDGLCGVALSLQPLPSCGFAGAQPRLTQNAAPLAFCRLCRASHLCRRQGRARKRTVKSESLQKQTLEMPQCGMIQSLTQESSQAGIKLTCGISFLYTWVNHKEQFLQPDCELSEEFKSDCLVWMLFLCVNFGLL